MTRAASLLIALLALVSTAAAATIRGTPRADRVVGSARADVLYGLGGNDVVHGLRGADFIDPGNGRDVVRAGDGPDRISVETDGARDRVLCGPGRDIVTADEQDGARGLDCEVVTRRISRDPFRGPPGQHATQVEPDSHAWATKVVAVFQVGRNVGGGARDIGFATGEVGRRWRSGRLPGVGVHSSPPGRAARVSDPVVGYDAVHARWLAATLAVSPGRTELLVSRSADGVAWNPPVVAAGESAPSLAYDKEWLTCDSWPTSRFRGRCYLSYTVVGRSLLATRVSADGGRTWSAPALTDPSPLAQDVFATGAQPVVRPDGTLVLVFLTDRALAGARSLNGGVSFEPATAIADVAGRAVPGMRAPPLPSADVAPDGTVYVAWHDCRLRPGCRANDVLIASSADGVRWSAPRRLPVVAPESPSERFLPGLAVNPAAAPHDLAVVYHSMPTSDCSPRTCRIDVWFARSTDGGETWGARRLNARSMRLGWIAATDQGRMLGDYVSTSFVAGHPAPFFSLASPPAGRRFRQAIYTSWVPG